MLGGILMNIKLIAMDMDGTLLQRDDTISTRTKEALIKAQEQGIRLVLASGRSYRKLMEYARELKMEQYGGYLIEVNGTALYDLTTNKRRVEHQLMKQDAMMIFNALQSFEVEILGMGDDAIYDYIPDSMMEAKRQFRIEHQLREDHPWTAGAFSFMSDNRIGYPNQFTIKSADEYPETLNKISAAHYPQRLDEQLPAIKAILEEQFWLGVTSPGWLEIMPKGVTKGNALISLSNTLQISTDEIMVFGDGENDIEMIQAVTYGVAMDNALPRVKSYAWHICEDHNHDGIANTVEQYILSK